MKIQLQNNLIESTLENTIARNYVCVISLKGFNQASNLKIVEEFCERYELFSPAFLKLIKI